MGWNAVALNVLPVFNPTMGYVNYVVPAVFVLILHQVLLMGTGILGRPRTSAASAARRATGSMPPSCHCCWPAPWWWGLFVLPVSFFGFCFDHYNIVRTAEPAALWLFTLPFLLATTWLGVVLGALFTRRDLPTQVVLVSSLPLVFLAGFIWPLELIPTPLNWLAQWVPSTPAIEGFLRLNQMGAEFAQVSHYWWQLWGWHCSTVRWACCCVGGSRRCRLPASLPCRVKPPPVERDGTSARDGVCGKAKTVSPWADRFYALDSVKMMQL